MENGAYVRLVQHVLRVFMTLRKKRWSKQEELHKISRLSFIFTDGMGVSGSETAMVKTLIHQKAKDDSHF